MPCLSKPSEGDPDVVPPQQRPDVICVSKKIKIASLVVLAGVVMIIVGYVLYSVYGYADPPPANDTLSLVTPIHKHSEGGMHYKPDYTRRGL